MTWNEKRKPYEFPKSTKKYALEKHGYRCVQCGEKPTSKDPLQIHHELPIEAVIKEYPFIAPIIVSHIVNAVPMHVSCHREYHNESGEADWGVLAVALVDNYNSWLKELISS